MTATEITDWESRRPKRADARRNYDAVVEAALGRVRTDAADPGTNLMPALLDAVRAYATLEEVVGALEAEFGRYVERPVI